MHDARQCGRGDYAFERRWLFGLDPLRAKNKM
jgi:hypothetical protein